MAQANSILTEAFRYASLGWKVFPVKRDKAPLTPNGFKDASSNLKQIETWWIEFPSAGIGIATGKVSGIVVLDVDLEKEGTEASLKTLVESRGEFSQDVVCRTGGGGYHVYFKHPGQDREVPNAVRLFGLTGIDIRGDGGYVVAPPSGHPSGNMYEWGTGQSPFDSPLAECPPYLYIGRKTTRSLTFHQVIEDGERNLTLTSIAGLLRSFGLSADEMFNILQRQNLERCVPPLEESEVQYLVDHIAQYPPFKTDGTDEKTITLAASELLQFEQTDTGFARMIALVYSGHIKYNHTRGTWVIWRRHWWERDDKEEILQLAIRTSEFYSEAVQYITDDDARTRAEKFSRRLRGYRSLVSGLTIARSEPQIATSSHIWNQQQDVLAVENGVVDLTNGQFIEGDPRQFISLHSHTEYDPHATCPRWLQFLSEIFLDDKEIIDFIQRAVGYSITGRTTEQCLFLLVGTGANGKSVFLDTIRELLGPYAFPAPFSTFERSAVVSSASNDIARLVGKRFVTASETNTGSTLHEARIKSLTGGEAISARFLHQEFFEFTPICKIWLGVNHLPRVKDDSEGFWRRVRRIDFPRTFSGKDQDPKLLDTLRKEMPGILAWAIQGAQAWYGGRLSTPQRVIQATETYRQDSDPLHDFRTMHCDEGGPGSISVDDLYRAYAEYGHQRQLKTYELLSSTQVRDRIGKQFSRATINGRDCYEGLQLKTSSQFLLKDQRSSIRISRRS